MIRKSGSMGLKLVDGSVCCYILAESAKMRRNYVIHRTDDMNCAGAETESPRCFGIQMLPPRN